MQGFAVPKESQGKVAEFSFHGTPAKIKHGDVVIAAITSCTNTSNPNVMLGAALVAKKACELDLEVWFWTSSSNMTKILIHWFTTKFLCWFGIFLFGGLWLKFSGNYHDNFKTIAAFALCFIWKPSFSNAGLCQSGKAMD